jgi:hypothetical protein
VRATGSLRDAAVGEVAVGVGGLDAPGADAEVPGSAGAEVHAVDSTATTSAAHDALAIAERMGRTKATSFPA